MARPKPGRDSAKTVDLWWPADDMPKTRHTQTDSESDRWRIQNRGAIATDRVSQSLPYRPAHTACHAGQETAFSNSIDRGSAVRSAKARTSPGMLDLPSSGGKPDSMADRIEHRLQTKRRGSLPDSEGGMCPTNPPSRGERWTNRRHLAWKGSLPPAWKDANANRSDSCLNHRGDTSADAG